MRNQLTYPRRSWRTRSIWFPDASSSCPLFCDSPTLSASFIPNTPNCAGRVEGECHWSHFTGPVAFLCYRKGSHNSWTVFPRQNGFVRDLDCNIAKYGKIGMELVMACDDFCGKILFIFVILTIKDSSMIVSHDFRRCKFKKTDQIKKKISAESWQLHSISVSFNLDRKWFSTPGHNGMCR